MTERTKTIKGLISGQVDMETFGLVELELLAIENEMEALRQPPVSGRSELLLAFGKFMDADCDLLGSGYIEEMVKKFEASNSH